MTTRNRATLKQFFEEGRRPTSDHFGDLIDSILNMSDEGFRKTPEHGFEVTSDEALLSFYREQGSQDPIWSVGFGGDNNKLLVRAGDGGGEKPPPPVLALDIGGQVGIGTDQPTVALDVRGVIASHGRQGELRRHTPEGEPLLADGRWRALTPPLKGCQAFEVTAGAGLPEAGRFALMHAVAMNTYNPQRGWLDFLSRRNRIRSQHAWYGQRCDRLELRWQGGSGKHGSYVLEVRTQCDYGGDCLIQASVTSLWSNTFMTGAART